ncbi:MAG: DUF4340 domain-containing protein [Verrucomicrobiota bacterium JB025]|nr:DUF4340 domain-containing protein [Verrucomicrobiota bacterium JB025]
MRSIGFTLLLLAAALVASLFAGWYWHQGDFESIFGPPATPVGERLYDSFNPSDVRHIKVSHQGTTARFSLTDNGWQATTPWNDRMDPRAAVGIIGFTLGMRVEDITPVDKIDRKLTGLDESRINIRLEDDNRRPLAKFKLGRTSSWLANVEGMDEPVVTVFAEPHDRHRKDHAYLVTGDITSLFKENLRYLRDHHPFYFNPLALSQIRIGSQQGELTIGREHPDDPWRIVKPLDLPANPTAIKRLIEGLYELQAVKLSNRADVTLPSQDASANQITLVPFGSQPEVRLDVLSPETPESREVRATVSDRPNTVFNLPLKPEPGLISLADLPLTVNDLRDPTLTHLNIASLRGIAIQSATSPTIIITREEGQPWMALLGDYPQKANEENLFSLLKTVTETRVSGFESDAATDFSPWGLDKPLLKLRFLAKNNQTLELRFGMNTKGDVFCNRLGTPTVTRVDRSVLDSIAVRPYEWRHSLLWSVNNNNLKSITRQPAGQPPLVLHYNWLTEKWTASRDNQDLTPRLDDSRANFMLSVLGGIKVSSWLSPDDPDAANALKSPELTISVTEKIVDDDDEELGEVTRTIIFAPAGSPGFHYGKLDTDHFPFLISNKTYQEISANIFE